MKLGIFINQAFYDFKGQISTDLSFVRFIESFGKEFQEIKIFAPTKKVSSHYEQGLYLCGKKIFLCQLPYYDNVKDLAKKALILLPRSMALLFNGLKDVDRLWIVGPHPLGLMAGFFADFYKIPSFLHIRGNILNDVKARYDNSMIGKTYARYMHWSNRMLSKKMTTLAVGSQLFDLYKDEAKVINWVSPSLITMKDIITTREGLQQKKGKHNSRVIMLFVGRVEPEKGLEYLFSALQELNQNTSNRYELMVVGGAQRGSEEKEKQIRQSALQMGIDQFITWKGYVPYSNEIKKIYREADVFVLPSLTEGIPKVIYEALAFGVPIVSTDVGGISDIIKHNHNGILIKPGSKDEIVSAVKSLLERPGFEKQLIENGLNAAVNFTIESARQKILKSMDV
jgi:glycosyltransferase involved in cell wall biosynthesis